MFRKLHNKIVKNVVVFTLVFTLLVSGVSFAAAAVNLYHNFCAFAVQNIEQGVSSGEFYIETAKSASQLVTQNQSVTDSLASGRYDYTINLALNTLLNTSYSIAGAVLYDASGPTTYASNNIANYLALEELAQNADIAAFLASDAQNFLSLRCDHIAGVYNNYRYPPEFGIITYITKLYAADGRVCGYLFSDISPSYLYSNFFSYEDYDNFRGVQSFLLAGDGYFHSSLNTPEGFGRIQNAPRQGTLETGGELLVSLPIFAGASRLVTVVPLTEYYRDLFSLLAILLSAVVLLSLASWLVARKLAAGVTVPLTELQARMNRDQFTE